jgi:hypothetical protein
MKSRAISIPIALASEVVATTLSNQDQFVAHGGSGCVRHRAIQLPTRATNFMAASDGLG